MNGREIARELKIRKGEKPSPGTIYPALKKLNQMELIKEERFGKTINYSLTKSGKQELKIAKEKFSKAFKGLF